MNRKQTILVILAIAIALIALTTYVLAGYGDMTSTNYALHGGFVGAVGGQITSTNVLAQETRLEPFGSLGWADGLPGQWLPPEQAFPITGTHPVVAFDDQGVLHAAWLEEGGIGYATMPEGGDWLTPTLVADSAGATDADLVVSPSGDAHLAWIEGSIVYYSFKPASGVWQDPASTIPTDSGNSRAPRLALDAGGIIHLAWYDATDDAFRYNHKPRGGVWRDNILHDGNPVPPDDIPDPNYDASDEFDLAIDSTGILHLVWCDGDHCSYGQKDTYYWTDTPIQLGTGVNLAAPALTVDDKGHVHAVWASRRITTTGGGITYCTIDNAGCSTTQIWAEGRDTDAPTIAIDAAGQAHIVWHEGAPSGELYYPRPDGSSGWSLPARLVHNMVGSHDPALTAGPSGVLHLMWGNRSLQRTGLYYMHTDPAPWQVTPNEIWVGTSPLITVTGHGFTDPIIVSVYSQTLTATIISSTTLTFTAPATLPGGWHDLALTRADGASNIIPRALWVSVPPTSLVMEEPIPTPYKAAFGVTIDPGGNVWFLEAYGDAVPEGGTSPAKLFRIPYDRYDVDLLHAEWILPYSVHPTALVADSVGYIWIYEPHDNQIIQLDPISIPGDVIIAERFDIPTPDAGVMAMAAAPNTNDIWFVEGNTGQLGWIDSETGSITDTVYAYDTDDLPTSLAIDTYGDVWFTLANSSRVGRYDVSLGVLFEYKTPTPDAQPMGITVGPYGYVWFTEYAAGKIGRGDPAQMKQNTANGITEYDIPTPDSGPYGIVADTGPDVGLGGRIWFTEKDANKIASWRADSLTPIMLIADDFSGGAGSWVTDTAWTVVDETLQGTGGGDFHTYISETLSWQNYTYQARVKLVGGGAGSSAGLTFRETDADNHYRAEIGLDADGYGFARLAKVVDGNTITTTDFFTPTNADVVPDHFYMLRVDVNENVLRFYVGDHLMVLAEDGDFAAGRIGLHGNNTTAHFDDVQVNRYAYSLAGYFDEYAIPTEGSLPQDIAVQYDGGDVWFTERGTHKVGSLVRQADSSPARLQYTLVTTGTWGDDPNPAYKLPWRSYQQGVTAINPYTITVEPAASVDPNWEGIPRIAAFTLLDGGITYRDNGPNDKDPDPRAHSIIGMQSTAWHSFPDLYAVQQPILVPIATIDAINPSSPGYYVQPIPENPVDGSGHGESRNGNPILQRQWRSSRDGELSTGDGFGPVVLEEGTHLLAYRVAVEDDKVAGLVWSPEDVVRYRVNMRPIARFEMRKHGVQKDGSLYDVTNETLELDGSSSYDPDGKVVAWEWRIDGTPLDCTDSVCSVNNLGIGQREISLKVWDNDGADSLQSAGGSTGHPVNFPDVKSLEVTRVPVIILHGYSFWPWDFMFWRSVDDTARYFDEHDDGYEYDGYPSLRGNVFLSNYALNMIPNGNLISYAGVLAAEVELIRSWTGADQVDLVAYSAGGNVARYYTRFIEPLVGSGRIRKFIMVGTPNHGQDTSVWIKGGLFIVDALTGSTFNLSALATWVSGEAAAMMEPQSSFLRASNGNDKVFASDDGPPDLLAPGIEHHVINGNVGDVMSRGRWVVKIDGVTIIDLWWPEFHTGDGHWILVPVGSAELNNVSNAGYPVEHGELDNDTRVRDKVLELLKSSGTQAMHAAPVAKDSSPGMPVYWTPSVLSTIAASEVFSYPVQIDSTTTRAHFQVSSIDPDLSVLLQDPSDRLIQPGSAERQPGAALLRDSQEKQTDLEYVVERPQVGTWHLIITGNPDSDATQPFYVSAMMETTVGLAVGTQVYTPTQTIQIYALARDILTGTMPITLTDGLIIARVERPDGQVDAFQLYDDGSHGDQVDGDGLFINTYNNTTQVGAYNVSVAGQFAYNGETILRRASTRTEIEADVQLALASGHLGQRRVAEFGVTQMSLKANQQTELVAYIHNSGRDDATDVLVHFYDGDPTQGGTFLGETTVDIPASRTIAARLPWQATRGVHDLYVVVDPYNFLMLRVEGGLSGALNAQMATAARAVVRDTSSPVADPGPEMTIPYSTTVRFDGLNSSDNVGVVTYTWQIDLSSIGRGTVTLDGPTPVLVNGIGISGTYTVTLTVYDADENSDTASIKVRVTEVPLIELPEVTNYGGAQVDTFSSLRALSASQTNDSITVNEDEDVQFVASADSGEFGLTSYNCEWTVDRDNAPNQHDLFGCRPVLEGGYRQPGTYHVDLQVSDMWGNDRKGDYPVHRTITVTVNDTTLPIVELPGISEDYWHVEPQLSFTGTVTDNVGVASVLFNGLPISVTTEGTFNATLTLDEGVNELNITATDAADNTTVVTRSVRYTAMDHFDVDISAGTAITAGEPFTATIIAQYTDDTTFPYTGTVRLDDTSGLLLPPQVQMTNGQWTGQLTLYAAQPVTITASARNRTGEHYVSQVSPAAFDHVVVWPTQVTLDTGQSQQLTAMGYDAYNNVITTSAVTDWSLVNGGGAIDENGLLTAGDAIGTYTNTIQATVEVDGASKTGWATLVVYRSTTFAPDRSATLDPGSVVTYTHHITNTGFVSDTFTVTSSSTQPGWMTLLDTGPFTLAVSTSAEVRVRVATPLGTGGLTDTTVLTITNSRTGVYAVVTDVTTVNHVPNLVLAPDHAGSTDPASVITYTHTLTNTGNGPDSCAIAHYSSQDWPVMYDTPVIVGYGQTATVVVSVTVPAASGVVTDVTVITATSQADSAVYATVTDTTVVKSVWHYIYLPLVLRDQ